MTQYIALPRGINAGHRMKMADLRAVFESLGYDRVRTVLASGNVLFEAKRTAEATLVRDLERALSATVGARIPVMIRTSAELERLADAEPFAKVTLGAKTRPFVTFLKTRPGKGRKLPQGEGYEVLGILDRTVCSIVDLSGASSPDLMRVLDQEFGNEVTTRGWPTVERILRALES
jgi:uncharacterized protein (DUF1697 family)